jgi:thiamine-monophosphate kinase
VAVNASDIAAMGGKPLGLLLSLAAPPDSEVAELLEVFDGFIGRARELGLDLIGGNLSASPGPLILDVTILGATLHGKLLKRGGARPGDAIYVSGRLGASAEGLELLRAGMALSPSGALLVPADLRGGPIALAEACIRKHIDPEPRIELGQFLCARAKASACIDLSDGLVRDLHRFCRASRVGARIEESALPIHPGVLAWERVRNRPPLELALSGGEDYELLFTLAGEHPLEEWRSGNRVSLTRVGVATEEEKIELVFPDGDLRSLVPTGWEHFRGQPEKSSPI